MQTTNSKRQNFFHTIKLSKETNRLLSRIKQKIDRKDFGKKSKKDRIILCALEAIANDENFIFKLQDETLTEKNRLERDHQDFCKKHGKITMDQYLGKLRRGELFEAPKKEEVASKNQSFSSVKNIAPPNETLA